MNEGNEEMNPITLFPTLLGTSFSSLNLHTTLGGGIIIVIFIFTEKEAEAWSGEVTCPRSWPARARAGKCTEAVYQKCLSAFVLSVSSAAQSKQKKTLAGPHPAGLN